MVIIVEGIDRIGKTTFCRTLSKKTGIPIFKENNFFNTGYSTGDELRETLIEKMSSIINIIETINCDIILDRFHLSEIVYGTVERNTHMYEWALWELDKKLSDIGAILCYMNPVCIQKSEEEHGARLIEHNEMFNKCVSRSTIKTIYEFDFTEIRKYVRKISKKYYRSAESGKKK